MTGGKKGFTLIEVMMVFAIIGLLATFLVPKIMDAPNKARVERAKADIKIISTALQMYHLDNGFYPSTEQGLEALIKEPVIEPVPVLWQQGGYLEGDSVPNDPWGRRFVYRSPGEKNKGFDLISFGADKKEGGSGYDADISN